MQTSGATFDLLAQLQHAMQRNSPKWVNHSEQPNHFWAIRTETTLNVYMDAIPEAQRRAVHTVGEVLFTNVHEISAATENQKVN